MTSVLCVYLTCGFNVCVTRSFRNQNSSSRKSICGMVLVSRGWPDRCCLLYIDFLLGHTRNVIELDASSRYGFLLQ